MYTPEINEIVRDSTTKDYVIVTNGIPIKDADGIETRKMKPTEGVVIRSCLSDGLFWAYISIEGHNLSPCRVTREEWDNAIAATKGRI
jgi:hypothetical protein